MWLLPLSASAQLDQATPEPARSAEVVNAEPAPPATPQSDNPPAEAMIATPAEPSEITSTESDQQWQVRLDAATELDAMERLRDQQLDRLAELRRKVGAYNDATFRALKLAGDGGDSPPLSSPESAAIRAENAAAAGIEPAWLSRDDHLSGLLNALERHGLRLNQIDNRIDLADRRLADALVVRIRQLSAQADNEAEGSLLAQGVGLVERNGERLLEQAQALTSERKAQVEQQRDTFQTTELLREAQGRLQLDSSGRRVGPWLWTRQRLLAHPTQLSHQLDRIRQQRETAGLQLIDLTPSRRLAHSALASTNRASGGDPALTALREVHVNVLDHTWQTLNRRVDALMQSETALLARIAATRDLWQIIDRQLLWIPSHPPMRLAAQHGLHQAFYLGVLRPGNPVAVGTAAIRANLADRAIGYGVIVAAMLALHWLRRDTPRRLAVLARAKRAVVSDRFSLTLKALVWTVLAALPWPLLLWLIGDVLIDRDAVLVSRVAQGHAIKALAPLLFCSLFLYWGSRENGLFRGHLRWPDRRCDLLRRYLPAMTAVLLPLYAIAEVAITHNISFMLDGRAVDTPARLALLALCGFALWSTWRLFAPGGFWRRREGSESGPLRWLTRLTLAGTLVVCLVLVLAGYIYSAFVLIGALLASVGIAIVVTLVHGLLARWFLLGERQLLQRRRDQRPTVRADADAPMPDAEDFPLQTLNDQSRRLLAAAWVVMLVLGLGWVWADVLQAFMRLDDITLWHFQGSDGEGQRVAMPVTAMSVLLGLTTLVVTFVAARNLPSLIEIGLLPLRGIDAATRYATISVARYAIVIVGILVGLSLFGLRWSQLQWLAAGLTVGLGFGLQEIFANFISGLILLFERPFRVGDVITVGDLSGRVVTIRTRATTILDFDNKEIVIPNKTFITGQLVNWTLSDSVTRITIAVAIVYGSDLDKTRALLLQAAQENPRVLSDPPASCVLAVFGERALEFQLRVFVGNIADRIPVQDELNTRISQLLSEHRIGVAFRPRDRDPELDRSDDDDDSLSVPRAPLA